MSGTGLKKWSPTTRSGRATASAIAPIDRALVFVARTTSGGAAASSVRKIERLRSRSSSAASITRATPIGNVVERGGDAQPRQPPIDPGVHRIVVELELRRPAAEAKTNAVASPLGRRGIDVVDDHVPARLERDLRDPGAHDAGADDPDRRHTDFIASNGWRQPRQ